MTEFFDKYTGAIIHPDYFEPNEFYVIKKDTCPMIWPGADKIKHDPNELDLQYVVEDNEDCLAPKGTILLYLESHLYYTNRHHIIEGYKHAGYKYGSVWLSVFLSRYGLVCLTIGDGWEQFNFLKKMDNKKEKKGLELLEQIE